MRQIGVQVQDIGSYLCWETFVDEPGSDLGLANLVHIAQPADLLAVPDQTKVAYPENIQRAFTVEAKWTGSDSGVEPRDGYILLTSYDPAQITPSGFQFVKPKDDLHLSEFSLSGEDLQEYVSTHDWQFYAKFNEASKMLDIGIKTKDGISWDDDLSFKLGAQLTFTPTSDTKKQIDDANAKKVAAGEAATAENMRKTKEEFINAVKERIELAAGITRRTFEDLREEERIIVYRRLIASLMTSHQYRNLGDSRSRHVLAELINSIFDIEKMLYFVAPEWWKPRERVQSVSIDDLKGAPESEVRWPDYQQRRDNYLITEKSAPAPLGSSLGWLLQLDGDSLRNAFLNAPWVKAVIPVRPGKEQAAINWLQKVDVEGSDGLDYEYTAGDEKELQQIRKTLLLADDVSVTIRHAVEFLCIQVAAKHRRSNETAKFPETEIDDSNKVTSTPVEKVYEHGFYPLKDGFRVNPDDQDPYFEVFDQWIEVLPTDQVAPTEVKYDPKTGRQV
jgi:hypothetical protein